MRCAICNRKLTNGQSMVSGVGPVCASRLVNAGQKKRQLELFKESDYEQSIGKDGRNGTRE